MDMIEKNYVGLTTTFKRKRVEEASSEEILESVWDNSTKVSIELENQTSCGTGNCQSVPQEDLGQSELLESKQSKNSHLQECKRPKFTIAKIKGSVNYEHFSAQLFDWPFKFSLRNACNFHKSGPPSRMMFYDHGEWKDFSEVANATLCESFTTGKTSAELLIDGKRYFVNFLQMLQLNVISGYLRSVAWLDVNGKCFFPYKCIEGVGNHLLSQFLDTSDNNHLLLSKACAKTCLKSSMDSYKDGLITLCTDLSNSPCETTSAEAALGLPADGEAPIGHDFTLLGDKLIKLNEADNEFSSVRNMFYTGLGMLATYTTISGIYKDCHKSMSGQARLQAFKRQEEITSNARQGNANIKYAWHGTSKQGVSGIILHGFGQPRVPKNGAMYGVGVYLAPEDYSHVSAVYSDVDENGDQHMVLCRAIMGNMEQVPHGSEQFHPSSEQYDTGVDDISNPKRYIIWSTHMNTHVLPEYIVSFKLASPWHGVIATLRGKQSSGKYLPIPRLSQPETRGGEKSGHTPVKHNFKEEGDRSINLQGSGNSALNGGCFAKAPRSPSMSFPMLFLKMRPNLPPEKMTELQQYYLQFKAGRMPREQLIKLVRQIAGDHLLRDSIKNMQAQEKTTQRVPNISLPMTSKEQNQNEGV